jgi:hypothetical protein
VWTSLPNNTADVFTSNDSICYCYNYNLSLTKKDVTCFGEKNGSINVKVLGGSSPYSFFWNNGSKTQNLSSLDTGKYYVLVKDTNMCTSSGSATINQPAALSLGISTTGATCGNANGSASVTVSGGIPPYSYQWTNGVKTSSLNNISAGVYTITVTDSNGCTITGTAAVTNTNGATVNYSVKNVTCNGGNNGSIQLAITGGTKPYSVKWSDGDTASLKSNLVAGTYNVTVIDSTGCKTVLGIIVTQPAALVVTTSAIEAGCGLSNGSASAVVSGGTSPYTYSWSNGPTTASITGISAGSYSVSVTDANGCTQSASIAVSNTGSPLIYPSISDVKCFGDKNGSIKLNVGGGFPPYTYSWSNGTTTKDISGVGAGSYTVIVTDSNNCKAVNTITISQPDSITLLLSSTPEHSGSKDGTAMVQVKGGTAPYQVKWSTGAQTDTIRNLSAGSYTVTVTDANGCTDTRAVVVSGGSGIPDITMKPSMNIYPNPGHGKFEIAISGITDLFHSQIEILDMVGNRVYYTPMIQGQQVYEIDPVNFSSGVYFIKLQSGKYTETAKFVLSK